MSISRSQPPKRYIWLAKSALRLFMSLFHYNGISKTFRFEELSEIIGIKTQKANFKTELKSRTSTNPKIDKKLKKYYNFKRRTLKTLTTND